MALLLSPTIIALPIGFRWGLTLGLDYSIFFWVALTSNSTLLPVAYHNVKTCNKYKMETMMTSHPKAIS